MTDGGNVAALVIDCAKRRYHSIILLLELRPVIV